MATCPNCEGHGEIGFNNTWNNDPQWDDSYACTYCDGTGTVTDELADTDAYEEWQAEQDDREFVF